MHVALLALRRFAVLLPLTMVTATTVVASPASAGGGSVYQDVNQPHYADTTRLAEDADLIVMGTVSATLSRTEGLWFQEVHEIDVTETLEGQPRESVDVVQNTGSTDGVVHVMEQHILVEGSDYVLFLAVEDNRFRTVGGDQGVFVPAESGWVSVAPSREDLTLGPLMHTETQGQSRPAARPALTPPPVTTSTPSEPPPAPVVPEPPDPPAEQSGPPPWLLPLVFLGGLTLGAVAAALGLTRRRAQKVEHGGTRPPAVAPPDSRPGSDTAAAAVQGLIAVTDLTDSPVLLAQVERSLRQAGVERVVADEGQPFDTQWHHGVSTRPAPRPELDLTVARVVRPGWRSADGLLRPVEVEVYRSDVR